MKGQIYFVKIKEISVCKATNYFMLTCHFEDGVFCVLKEGCRYTNLYMNHILIYKRTGI